MHNGLEHTTESVSQVWFAEFAHGIFQANFLEDRNFVFGKSSKTKLVFSFGTGNKKLSQVTVNLFEPLLSICASVFPGQGNMLVAGRSVSGCVWWNRDGSINVRFNQIGYDDISHISLHD